MVWTPILRTVAGPGVCDEAQAALDRAWSMNGHVPDIVRMHTAIAVAEIVANMVEHGSAGRHLVQIEMEVSVQPDRVLVALADDGNEARIDVNAICMPGDGAERGRGLAMARRVLDTLAYQRLSGANRWVLTSNRF
jgi:serine/threonine-protein kinase RsbW